MPCRGGATPRRKERDDALALDLHVVEARLKLAFQRVQVIRSVIEDAAAIVHSHEPALAEQRRRAAEDRAAEERSSGRELRPEVVERAPLPRASGRQAMKQEAQTDGVEVPLGQGVR